MNNKMQAMSSMGMMFLIIVIMILLAFASYGYIYQTTNCRDMGVMECILSIFMAAEDVVVPEGTVTATGSVTKEFSGTIYSVTFSMSIPLAGGVVTGSFSGDCDGKITGNFAGGEGGVITGSGNGSCSYVFPASGNFNGTVNQVSKSIPLTGNASVAGIGGEGALTLTY